MCLMFENINTFEFSSMNKIVKIVGTELNWTGVRLAQNKASKRLKT